MSRTNLVVAAALGLTLIACSKGASVDDELKKIQPKVDGKLANIVQITSGLASVDRTKAYAGAARRLVDSGPPMVGDTLLTYPADLAALAADTVPPLNSARHATSLEVPGCWYAVKKREYGSFPSSSGSYMAFTSAPVKAFQVPMMCEQLAHASYLAVAVENPSVRSGGGADLPDQDKAASTFTGYNNSGLLEIFDLSSGEYLGQVPYGASNSSTVTYKTDKTGVGSTIDAELAAGANLERNTVRAIEDALALKK